MTRIRILERSDMNDAQGKTYDKVKAAGGPVGGPYYAYIRNPRLMEASQEMGNTLRESPLSGVERQIAVLTAVRFWNAKYPWHAQVRGSLAAGVSQETVDAINHRKPVKLANPREQMAHDLAKELLEKKSLSEATYKAAEKLFSEEEMVALIAVTGQFSMVSCTANAYDVTPPADGAKLAD